MLFVIAFVIYAALWPDAPLRTSDSWTYATVARDLADFRLDKLHDRTPGYPILLAITGSASEPQRSLYFLSLVLHFATIWMLATVLYAAGFGEAALLSFGLFLLLPPYVEWAGYQLSENVAQCMLAGAVAFLAVWWRQGSVKWVILAGAATGYSALARPSYQALGVAMGAALVLVRVLFGPYRSTGRRLILAGGILVGVSGAIVGCYATLNYVKFDFFGLSPMSLLSLPTRTAGVVERLPDEYAQVRDVLVKARDAALVNDVPHTGYPYIWRPGVLEELSEITGLEGAELNKYVSRLSMMLIRVAPMSYLAEVSRAFGEFWLPASTSLANMDSRLLQLLWALIHIGVIGVWVAVLVVTAGAVGFIMIARRSIVFAGMERLARLRAMESLVFVCMLVASIVFYVALLSSFLETGDPRYRVPTDPLIVMMCFLGADLGRRLIRDVKTVFDDAARCMASQ